MAGIKANKTWLCEFYISYTFSAAFSWTFSTLLIVLSEINPLAVCFTLSQASGKLLGNFGKEGNSKGGSSFFTGIFSC